MPPPPPHPPLRSIFSSPARCLDTHFRPPFHVRVRYRVTFVCLGHQTCGFDEAYFPFTINCFRGCCDDSIRLENHSQEQRSNGRLAAATDVVVVVVLVVVVALDISNCWSHASLHDYTASATTMLLRIVGLLLLLKMQSKSETQQLRDSDLNFFRTVVSPCRE